MLYSSSLGLKVYPPKSRTAIIWQDEDLEEAEPHSELQMGSSEDRVKSMAESTRHTTPHRPPWVELVMCIRI